MKYSHKIVIHYPDGTSYTLKLDENVAIFTARDIAPLIIAHKALAIYYHTPYGAWSRYSARGHTDTGNKKPPRTTNPYSKTKTQKKAEMMAKAKEATIRCRDFITNLQDSILKTSPPSKYHFWLGESV